MHLNLRFKPTWFKKTSNVHKKIRISLKASQKLQHFFVHFLLISKVLVMWVADREVVIIAINPFAIKLSLKDSKCVLECRTRIKLPSTWLLLFRRWALPTESFASSSTAESETPSEAGRSGWPCWRWRGCCRKPISRWGRFRTPNLDDLLLLWRRCSTCWACSSSTGCCFG